MSKSEEFLEMFSMPWGQDLQGLSEQMRTGPAMMSRISQLASKTGQTIAARQTQHLTDVLADVTVLFRDGMPKPNDPAATARAYTAFLQSGVQRQLSLFGFYAETMAAMAKELLPAAQVALDTEEHEHHMNHTPAPKSNGRAVPAKS